MQPGDPRCGTVCAGSADGSTVTARRDPGTLGLGGCCLQRGWQCPPSGATGPTDRRVAGVNDGVPHLAERLELLFCTVPRAVGSTQLHSADSVAAALAAQGIHVTPTHLANLRAGRRDNPSAVLLAGIARVFDVPLAYFFEDDVAQDASSGLRTLTALRDAGVQKVMLRAQGVSPTSLEAVATVLAQIRLIEGLDEAAPAAGEGSP